VRSVYRYVNSAWELLYTNYSAMSYDSIAQANEDIYNNATTDVVFAKTT